MGRSVLGSALIVRHNVLEARAARRLMDETGPIAGSGEDGGQASLLFGIPEIQHRAYVAGTSCDQSKANVYFPQVSDTHHPVTFILAAHLLSCNHLHHLHLGVLHTNVAQT
ncbi:MAG TPA: hypothetical protein VFJ16_19810 [Longimicrobium sp.]|nr:hypothetical protein [Longimicrobium sp.]